MFFSLSQECLQQRPALFRSSFVISLCRVLYDTEVTHPASSEIILTAFPATGSNLGTSCALFETAAHNWQITQSCALAQACCMPRGFQVSLCAASTNCPPSTCSRNLLYFPSQHAPHLVLLLPSLCKQRRCC